MHQHTRIKLLGSKPKCRSEDKRANQTKNRHIWCWIATIPKTLANSFQMMIIIDRIAFFIRSSKTTSSNHTAGVNVSFFKKFNCKNENYRERNHSIRNCVDRKRMREYKKPYTCKLWFGKMLRCHPNQSHHISGENRLLCVEDVLSSQHIPHSNVNCIDNSWVRQLNNNKSK